MGLGMLTSVGMRQHYLLGSEVRQRYIQDQRLLDSEYNADQIEIYSTLIERTYYSALSQFSGIYPNIQQNIKNQKLSQTQQKNAILPIQVGTDPDYDKLLFEEFKAIDQKDNQMLQTLEASLNKTNQIGSNDQIFDEIQQAQANGLKMPFTLTEQDQMTIKDFKRFDLESKYALKRDAALFDSQTLRKIIADKLILRVQNNTDLRLILMSLHDTDISLLLVTIDQPQNEQPPVATTLFLELYKSSNTSQDVLYIRAKYNDRLLNLHKYCYDTDNSIKFNTNLLKLVQVLVKLSEQLLGLLL
ncbi:lysosomal acid phosphatase-like [Stylonychia lemnae]|uniref:Lysosomal acid phosphatase-like n=1 Tax=Stylonychia lemnae TaxID=5949 RepID=A0A077ZRS8_STYLE|nr:lysosomal acid phosphatase-like [Stylonychia lemnae]|eukprot:CDW72179.1 lysosomal acid phosphatase-like [Stylonychia lemnae]